MYNTWKYFNFFKEKSRDTNHINICMFMKHLDSLTGHLQIYKLLAGKKVFLAAHPRAHHTRITNFSWIYRDL